MILSKLINRKTLLISAGMILTAYLIVMLTVSIQGQNKLKNIQHHNLQLKIAHYASSLSYFFEVSRDKLAILSQNKIMTTFFDNRLSVISEGAELDKNRGQLKNLLHHVYLQQNYNYMPIFNKISLLNLDGSAIILNGNDALNIGSINTEVLLENGHFIYIKQRENNISIKLLQVVYINNDPVAIISAPINNQIIVQQLTAHENVSANNHLELRSNKGKLFIWGKDTTAQSKTKHNQSFLFEESIKRTPFTLVGWSEPINNQNLFISNWFIVVISILTALVILGIYMLMYIQHNRRILQTETSFTHQLAIHHNQLNVEINKRKTSEKTLRYRATHDSLTGLINRDYSLKKLEDAIDISQRNNTKILLVNINLDNFKQINDISGHSAGDQVLIESSKRLLSSLRKTDTVARIGGDEFLLILSDLKDDHQATSLAAKMLTAFEQPFKIHGQNFFSSTCIGLSIYPQDGDTPEALLKCASMALRRAKGTGKNNFSFYTEKMNAEVIRNITIKRRLRYAIENNGLEMHYQPLIDLQTGKILGAEALMRWTDSEFGIIYPDEFIPLAERCGLIHQLGEFALTQACTQAAKWQTIAPIQMAVNFSSVQFRNCYELLDKIITTLDKTGLPKSKLDVEVTESLLMSKEGELNEMLSELRDLDIQLSIDDFGTGYSALSYLQKYAFSKLKIDRAFIMNLSKNEADRSLVTAIIAMAKALNLKIVAEGIEEQQQADFLKQLNCDYGQGYLYSRPVPASEFEKLLIADNS